MGVADKTFLTSVEQSIRKKQNHKRCPICKQNVVSDATKMQACALCGMIVDTQNVLLHVEDSEEKYFCLHGCYEKYNKINIGGDINNGA